MLKYAISLQDKDVECGIFTYLLNTGTLVPLFFLFFKNHLMGHSSMGTSSEKFLGYGQELINIS